MENRQNENKAETDFISNNCNDLISFEAKYDKLFNDNKSDDIIDKYDDDAERYKEAFDDDYEIDDLWKSKTSPDCQSFSSS